MKLALRLLLALCLVAPVLGHAQATSEEEEAGDVSEVDKDRLGPLRERVRPVSGHLFLKKGRFEFSPSASVSLRDAFFSKYIFGGTLTYHPLETVGVSLRVGYAVNTVAGAAQLCTFDTGTDGSSTRGCSSPSMNQLDGRAPGQLKLLAGADVQWAPIYGKLSLLAEKFISFDLYGVGGVSMVQYRGPDLSENLEVITAKNYMTPGGNVGVGARFFLNRWITLRTEVRDLIYVEKSRGSDNYLRNQLLFELGVSFFFLNGSES
jgi:outer membrane beta-barrel protein